MTLGWTQLRLSYSMGYENILRDATRGSGLKGRACVTAGSFRRSMERCEFMKLSHFTANLRNNRIRRHPYFLSVTWIKSCQSGSQNNHDRVVVSPLTSSKIAGARSLSALTLQREQFLHSLAKYSGTVDTCTGETIRYWLRNL